MKQRILYVLTCVVMALVQPIGLRSAMAIGDTPHIAILAIQTGQVGAPGNDFIELYNPSATAVDVTSWKLQYRAAAAGGAATWTTKRVVACVPAVAGCTVTILPYGHLVVSTYDIPGVTTGQLMASGLSDVGGQLRFVQPVGSGQVVHDLVGYGTAAEAEATPAPAPSPSETLARRVEGMTAVDTNNNVADFKLVAAGCYTIGGSATSPIVDSCILPPADDPAPPTPPVEAPTPTPEVPLPEPPQVPPAPDPATSEPPQPPVDTPVEPPTPEPTPAPIPPVLPEYTPPADEPPVLPVEPVSVAYAPLYITELLPDPATPATDAADEYIELFNPGANAVVADGYVLETGATFTYHFALAGVVVPAGGYATVMSGVSHLTLSNTSGAARLLDPAGNLLDQTTPYESAHVGQAWAKVQDVWQWTTIPTPTAANQATPAPPDEEEDDPTPVSPTPEDEAPGDDMPAPQPEPPAPVSYPHLIISELLPDPTAPALDGDAEFIELFNPNPGVADLSGYTLQAGTDFRYKFVLNNLHVEPGSYIAVMSAVSHLPLSNSGTLVQLLDPNGDVVDTVASYGTAKAGQAWAKLPDGWYWTTTPTPGGFNKRTLPPVIAKATKATKKTIANKKKSTAIAKVASAKTASGAGTLEVSDQPDQPFNYLLLVPVGLLVVGYVVYEYRQNIARWFRKLRPAKKDSTTRQTD